MVVVAGAFGFPRKQVGLSHSRPDITSSNQPSCSSRASFSSALLTSSQAELSGAIDRNWPALLQGIQNTIALSQPRYSQGETMPDSRDAFLSLWNPLCHLFLLFCLCFCALLLHSYVHLLRSFQVKDGQDGIRPDDNRSSVPMSLSSCKRAINVFFLVSFWRISNLKFTMKELLDTLCTFLISRRSSPHSLWWNLLNWWRHCPMSAEELLCDCCPQKEEATALPHVLLRPIVGPFLFFSCCNLILLFSVLLFPTSLYVRACCQRLPCSKL